MARRPINPPLNITTEFGVKDPNSLYGRHTGVDYAKPTGTPVLAPASGKVVGLTHETYNGNVVHLFDGKYYHRLMHNKSFTVNVGQAVKEGQQVAISDNTGLSTGPHVHWDVATVQNPTSFSQFIPPATWLATFKPPAPKPKYPRTVTVTVPLLYVRSAPRTSAPLAGSKTLKKGVTFVAKGQIAGESINGNNIWLISTLNHYCWSGGCK